MIGVVVGASRGRGVESFIIGCKAIQVTIKRLEERRLPMGVTLIITVCVLLCFINNKVAKREGTVLQWLFSQNVIQLQPHGSKNPIVLYQEMWLHVSNLLSAATSQQIDWSGPRPGT